MLKNIPVCISPDLMHAMLSMGHGDEIIISDSDFPATTYSQRLIRADGLEVATLLDAILQFYPLDTFVENPVATMDASDWSKEEPPSYQKFRDIIKRHDKNFTEFEYVKRFDFYERAGKAYTVIAKSTPEGNLILKNAV